MWSLLPALLAVAVNSPVHFACYVHMNQLSWTSRDCAVAQLRSFSPLWRLQTVYITDPFLLQEVFAAERAGLIEKPKLQLVQVRAPRFIQLPAS